MPQTEQVKSPLQQVVDHVEGLVFEELEPGAQLPSEGDLAQSLGVSRLTVREGMRHMSARGLVEVHNGRRPVVAVPNGRSVGDFFRSTIRRDPRALLDLLDVRLALETHNAALAAVNAGRGSLHGMQSAINDMERGVGEPEAFNDADVRFHELLATATGNQMLATLIEELSSCLRTSRSESVAGHRRRGLGFAEVIDEHRAILRAVESHDASKASAAMRTHLRHTGRDLAAAIQE